jgi:hypothetical protein
MDFPGPDPADFAEVEALNRAFLDYLAGTTGRRLARDLPPPLLASLTGSEAAIRARIATCPFFLFSLGQNDDRLWAPLFAEERRPDLVDALEPPPPPEARIACAALAFLWRYAGHNPYAVRVLSGADSAWCERIADCALVDLIEYAASRGGLLRLRCVKNAVFWRRILVTGACEEDGMRHAAHIWALQSMLTRPSAPGALRLPAAACSMSVPAMQVADRGSVSQSTSRRYNTPPHEGPVDPASRKDVPQR